MGGAGRGAPGSALSGLPAVSGRLGLLMGPGFVALWGLVLGAYALKAAAVAIP